MVWRLLTNSIYRVFGGITSSTSPNTFRRRSISNGFCMYSNAWHEKSLGHMLHACRKKYQYTAAIFFTHSGSSFCYRNSIHIYVHEHYIKTAAFKRREKSFAAWKARYFKLQCKLFPETFNAVSIFSDFSAISLTIAMRIFHASHGNFGSTKTAFSLIIQYLNK